MVTGTSNQLFYPVMILNPNSMDCMHAGMPFTAYPCMSPMAPVGVAAQSESGVSYGQFATNVPHSILFGAQMMQPMTSGPSASLNDTGGPPGNFTRTGKDTLHMKVCGSQPVAEKHIEDNLPLQLESPTALLGQVWKLAKDPKACRLVQQAFEDADCDDTRAALASELRTHVWEALKSPNANHVLQKCISTIRPLDLQFIVDELMQAGKGAVCKAARHRYGCRVVQRLLEHCPTEQKNRLVEELLTETVTLCTHIFGNYVMQHILEHGTDVHILSLTQILTEHASTVCSDPHGSAVLEKCFSHASPTAQVALANALVMEPDKLATMGCTRHGNRAAKQALAVADLQHRSNALMALIEQKEMLRVSRYGRVLATFAEKCMQGEAADNSGFDDDNEV